MKYIVFLILALIGLQLMDMPQKMIGVCCLMPLIVVIIWDGLCFWGDYLCIIPKKKNDKKSR